MRPQLAFLSRPLPAFPRCHRPCTPLCARRARPRDTPESPPSTPSSKKPYGYWAHLPNVLSELRAYLSAQSPAPTIMPTERELTSAGRADLAGAIRRHSWRAVAARIGLPLSSIARPRALNLSFCTELKQTRLRPYMYWREWGNVSAELRAYMHEAGGGMPTARELEDAGRSDLKRAIALHGGSREVARRLGVAPRSRPKAYWSWETVQSRVKDVAERTGGDAFPTVEELQTHGERGLLSAVRRFGGLSAVAKRMGLSVKRRRLR